MPVYAANGTQFYLMSLATFLVLAYVRPDLCVQIYHDMSAIAAVLNFTALLLCAYLVVKGKTKPEDAKDNDKEKLNYPLPYLFFAGEYLQFPVG